MLFSSSRASGLMPWLARTWGRLPGVHEQPSPPAVWGKLPGYGDYVRWNSPADEGAAWQRWVVQHWHAPAPSRRHEAARSRHTRTPGGVPWLKLDPAPAHAQAHALWAVPVAFILAPGNLDFAPAHFLQGVLVDSQDRVGRACPLIIYQRIHPAWFQTSWASHFSDRPRRSTRHLLFWLARLAARIHAQDTRIDVLGSAVDDIWLAHTPNWRHAMGASPPQPDPQRLDARVQGFSPHDERDTAHGLSGVPRLPWQNGLARVTRTRAHPSGVFWQQDPQGGYVNAAERWEALWTP